MGWPVRVLGAPRPAVAPALPAGAVLIDEYDSGHIEGAVSLPLDRVHFAVEQAEPAHSTPLLLHCRFGVRSASACAIVSGMGCASGGTGVLSLLLGRAVTTGRR